MKTPKALINRVLIFALPLLIAAGYVEIRLGDVKNSYNSHRTAFQDSASDIEVLVLGHSQAAYDIDPAQFHRVGFNLANIGQDLYYDTALTLRHIDSMPKLSTVVVTISYFGLWYKLSNESEEWRRCFYYQFWDMEPESDTFDPRNISKIALYSPGVSIDYLMQGFDVDISRNDSNGWQSLLGGPIEFLLTDESSENRMLAHNEFIHRNHLNDNLSYIDRLLTELQSRDVRVVLVTVPVYGRYLKHADPQILSENHRIIAGIASRYSVSYHDYSRDTRFGYQDFYDPDHLNQTGAQKFSRLLDAEVLVTQFDDHGDR